MTESDLEMADKLRSAAMRVNKLRAEIVAKTLKVSAALKVNVFFYLVLFITS